MKILSLINKYKFWIISFILIHVLVGVFYLKAAKNIDVYLCSNGHALNHCAESPFFKDEYKNYFKFMMNNYNKDYLLKNEIFAKNFSQIMKVCEIKRDCNTTDEDWSRYKENRKLCAKYFNFCKIDYIFIQYNNSTLIVKKGFKDYIMKEINK